MAPEESWIGFVDMAGRLSVCKVPKVDTKDSPAHEVRRSSAFRLSQIDERVGQDMGGGCPKAKTTRVTD